MTKIICLLGMAGSGKSTLARQYIKEHSPRSVLVEAGAIARKMAETDTETRDALARGEIAPVERMDAAMKIAMAEAYLDASMHGGHVFIDGYPRYAQQVETLMSLFDDTNLVAVKLSCTEHVARIRLMARGRADDSPELIATRHAFYWEHTVPAADALMKRLKYRIVLPCFGFQDEAVSALHAQLTNL